MPNPLKELMSIMLGDLAEIAEGMSKGSYTADEFQSLLMLSVMEHHAAAYMAGLGTSDLSPNERAELIRRMEAQRGYADAFADQIALEGWQEADASRLALYAGALKASYWKGATWELDLPAQPSEGSECMVNCKCYWEIVEVNADNGDYDCYWRMGGTENHCATCPDRAAAWAPYRIREGEPA